MNACTTLHVVYECMYNFICGSIIILINHYKISLDGGESKYFPLLL